jgi:hypothetical protein
MNLVLLGEVGIFNYNSVQIILGLVVFIIILSILSCIAKCKYAIEKDRILHYLKDSLIIICLIGFTIYLFLYNEGILGKFVLFKEYHLMSYYITLMLFSGVSITIDIDLYLLKRFTERVLLDNSKINPYYRIILVFCGFWSAIVGILRNYQLAGNLIMITLALIIIIKAGFWIRGMKKAEKCKQ